MYPTIEKMLQHASVRNFKPEALPLETKNLLITAAQSGSSSNFVQAYTIIEIADESVRREIAEISGSAAYVNQTGAFYLFVADWYRQAEILRDYEQELAALRNMEALTVAVVDTTIAAQNMAIAAESMDLGVCYIGGIRNNLAKVAQILDLPELTVPLFGLSVGYPNFRNEVKPRLPQHNIFSVDGYDRQKLTDLSAYKATSANYYKQRTSHQKDTDWTQEMSQFLSEPRRKDVANFLKQQGFTLS